MFYTLSRQCSVDWFIKFTLSDTITECAVVNVQWRVIYMFIKKNVHHQRNFGWIITVHIKMKLK